MTQYFNGAEDGDTSEFTLDGDGDGQNYRWIAQTSDVYDGSYAFEQYLEGSGGAATYTESTSVGLSENGGAPVLRFAFKRFHAANVNTGFESRGHVLLDVTLTDGTTETITYRVATLDTNPSTDASNLFFVVSNHNSSSWTLVERDINQDLSDGGYANVSSIDTISVEITTPGSGGGSDRLGVRYDSFEVLTAPDPPLNLSAAADATDPEISLNWDGGDSSAEEYRLYRSTASGVSPSDTLVATPPASTTSHLDSALSEGTQYHYVVTAANDAGESSTSNEASDTTHLPPPTNLAVSNVGVETADLSWTDNAADEDGYLVETRSTGGTWQQAADLAANATSHTLTDLLHGREQEARVAAYTADTTSYDE